MFVAILHKISVFLEKKHELENRELFLLKRIQT